MADLTAACGEKILNPEFLLQGGGQPFTEHMKLNNNHTTNNSSCSNSNGKSVNVKADKSSSTATTNTSTKLTNSVWHSTTHPSTAQTFDEEDPLQFILKRPVITLYSQKMKGLKDLLLAEKLNTHAISLQVTAQSVASKKVRGIDKLGNHTSNSTYANINMMANNNQTNDTKTGMEMNESIAVTRPKRSRRE